MCQSLPLDILAQGHVLMAALVAVARQQPGATLATLEAGVRQTVQEALPALLGALLPLAIADLDPGIATVGRRCPAGHRVRMHSTRPRTVHTTAGALTFTRPWYHCATCGSGFAPADATLGLPARARISPALEDWLVRLGVHTTPREATAVLAELTGVVVAADTIREHTTAVGTALADAQAAAVAQVVATREAAEPVEPAPGMLVVETDGVMVRYRDGWHEVRVAVVGGVADGEVTAASYVAARAPAASFGGWVLAEAARRGALTVVGWSGPLGRPALATLPPVQVVGDGAAWIWALAAEHFGERVETLDFYHAAQHVWTVARAVFGEGSAEASAWASARISELREQGGGPVQAALFGLTAPTLAAAEVLRTERGYFTTNRERMAYPELRARGLLIGSGAVESSAKHVVQARMKLPGQRWSEAGGRAMLTLRARLASGRSLCRPPSVTLPRAA